MTEKKEYKPTKRTRSKPNSKKRNYSSNSTRKKTIKPRKVMKQTRKKNNNPSKLTILSIAILALVLILIFSVKKDNRQVAATINGHKIYKSQVEKRLKNIFESQNLGKSKSKAPALESLPKEVIEVLAKEVYLDDVIMKKAKEAKIRKNPEVREKIRAAKRQIIRAAYNDHIIKTKVSDKALLDKYNELKSDLKGKKEYLISHIVTSNKSAINKAQIELKSKNYKNFSSVAKKYSIDQNSASKGGEIGYVIEDNIFKEIQEKITKLKKNEVSSPIKTKYGWHIIKVSDIRDAEALPFEDVKEALRNQLSQDVINDLNSEIVDDAKVEVLIYQKPSKEKSEVKEDDLSHDDDDEDEDDDDDKKDD